MDCRIKLTTIYADRMVRQTFVGTVINILPKTVKVRVERQKLHPKVQKLITYHKNFLSHDENTLASVGDVVRITACRPLSPRKFFEVTEIIKPAEKFIDENGKLITKLEEGMIKQYPKSK